MAKRILKAREVDRLENTTFLTSIAIAQHAGTDICSNCDNTCTNVGVVGDIDICSDCRNTCTNIGVIGTGTRTIEGVGAIGVGDNIAYRL